MSEYNILWSTFKWAHATWIVVLEEGGIGEMLRHLINMRVATEFSKTYRSGCGFQLLTCPTLAFIPLCVAIWNDI